MVKFVVPNFVNFSSVDLEWLKNDNKWLLDLHITLVLLWVNFFLNSSITQTKRNSNFFHVCADRKIWGSLEVKLLDNSFWENLSLESEKYSLKYQNRLKLMECDSAVMPMFQL